MRSATLTLSVPSFRVLPKIIFANQFELRFEYGTVSQNLRFVSAEPESSNPLGSLHSRSQIANSWPRRIATGSPDRSQTVMNRSQDPVKSRLSSGENASAFPYPTPSKTDFFVPVFVFQMTAVPSCEMVAISLPLPPNTTSLTGPSWPSNRLTCRPLEVSQSRTAPSSEPLAKKVPVGEKANPLTEGVCPPPPIVEHLHFANSRD